MTTTTFVMFNEVAQRLLGSISASTLLDQVGFTDTIPDAIQDLCGTKLIFRLKLNSRNLQECMENYKVTYTFEPKDNLEMEYLKERSEEVCTFTFHTYQNYLQNYNKYVLYRAYWRTKEHNILQIMICRSQIMRYCD